MSLLGRFIKQPVEVEFYGIQFVEDMTGTDEIISAWQVISRETAPDWDRVVQSVPYTALLTDAERTLVSTADITLPIDALDGYRFYAANKNAISSITVGSISIPARGSSVITKVNGLWEEEAKTNSILVTAIGDQRVRVRVFGGTAWQTYKVQVTVETTEGRTLQDEFTVDIEES